MAVAGQGDTVELQYIGDKKGTLSRRGPISKKWYTFSASVNNRFHCARADAQYLLRAGDLAVVPQAAPPSVAPPPAPVAAPPMPTQIQPAPVPQVTPVPQPTVKQEVPLREEPPADDLSEIKGVTRDTAGILALIGVRTFENLAALEKLEGAAQMTGKSIKQVRGWVRAAKEIVQSEEAEIDLGGLDSGRLGDLGVDLFDDVQLVDREAEE